MIGRVVADDKPSTMPDFSSPLVDSNHQMRLVSFGQSTKALLREEFSCGLVTRQTFFIALLVLFLLLQETIWLYLFTALIEAPNIDYNDVKATWKKQVPLLGFANTLTATGQETSPLFSLYNSTINSAGQQIQLEETAWAPQSTFSVNETLTEVAIQYYDMMELALEESEKEAYGAYYVYDMNERTNSYSIGVFGNQLGGASSPTFGATILETLAQKILGNDQIKLSFVNNMLPAQDYFIPQLKPVVVEIFGASILAATVVVMIFQITIFGKPIDSGFYSSFVASGGDKRSYVCSKYLKSVLVNFIFSLCTLAVIFGQRYKCLGLWLVLILWSFVNPLYLFTRTAQSALFANKSYKHEIQKIYQATAALGMIALITSGTYIYSQRDQFTYVFLFYQLLGLNPSSMLYFASQVGFLYERHEVEESQLVNVVDLSPWSDVGSYLWIVVPWMIFNAVLWTFLLKNRLKGDLKGSTLTRKRSFHSFPALTKDECPAKSGDVLDEDVKVESLISNQTHHVVIVKDLQTVFPISRSQLAVKAEPGEWRGNIYFHTKKTIGVYDTKSVSFAVAYGERLVFLSPESGGVDSIFLSLLGQKLPIAGQVIVDQLQGDQLTKSETGVRGIVGYQPAKNGIDDDLTVEQHLTIFAEIAGVGVSSLYYFVSTMILDCQLSGLEKVMAGQLSQGQLRRLTLGMALIGRPKLVVLNNPLQGVDPFHKTKLIQTILKYTEGRALIMSTKDAEIAQLVGHRVGILSQGALVSIGTVDEILRNHGKGFSLELQVDMDKLGKQAPQLGLKGSEYVESVQQAWDLLDLTQQQLEESNVKVAYEDLSGQFSEEGDLKMQYKQVEAGAFVSWTQFINMVLVLNLTMCVRKKLLKAYPTLQAQVASIEGDLVRIELGSSSRDFDLGTFNKKVNEIVESFAISYFTLGAITLEQVYAKLTLERANDRRSDAHASNVFLTRHRTMLITKHQVIERDSINETENKSLLLNESAQSSSSFKF